MAIYRQKLGLACNVVLQNQVFFSLDDYRLEFRETPNFYYSARLYFGHGTNGELNLNLEYTLYFFITTIDFCLKQKNRFIWICVDVKSKNY